MCLAYCCVDNLEDRNRESCGLSCSGLRLCDDIAALNHGHDGALLDGRRTLETVGVDSTEELALEVHRIEGVGGLIVVGFDLGCTGAGVSARMLCLL